MSDEELLPIVDECCNVTGSATRRECHSGSMLLHPVVHLHILSEDGNGIYLQKRSLTKDIQPGKWDTAVGGHVDFGETIDESLRREVFEELGFEAANPSLIKSYIFQSEIERELVNVFLIRVGSSELGISINHDEISDGMFWTLDEIAINLGKGIFTPNFESEFSNIILPNIK